MKVHMCPNCQGIKLIRARVLTPSSNPNSGKEYLSCPRCTSRWFMDDPNRPPAVDVQPKQSIWKTLATWGAPHNEPDVFGVLHPFTYVFPPRREYPSPFLPTSSTPRQSVLVSESIPSVNPQPTSPAIKAPEQPTSPAPPEPSEPALLPAPSPREPQVDPLPPVEEAVTIDQQPQKDNEPHQAEVMTQEMTQIPSEHSQSQLNLTVPAQEDPPHSEEHRSTSSNMDSEEQARYELLSRIVNSPLPPFLDNHPADTYEPPDHKSTHSNDYQPSVDSKTSPKSFTPEEEHLLQKLLRVATSPCPPTPMVYTSHMVSPKIALQQLTDSESYREELDNAAHARQIAERIEHAIQNSPFLSGPERWIKSPEQLKSPASKHSGLRSSRHSIAQSVPATPHVNTTSNKATMSMPHSPHVDDPLPLLPGAFPTPKPTPLTAEALSSLGRQSSRHGGSVRSTILYNSLPVAPNYQNSTRASMTSAGRSPLFS